MLSASRIGRKAEPVIHTAVVSSQLELRLAIDADLGTVNAVIERAVMTWKLPERVKRLAMPSYRYAGYDLKYLHIVVAEDSAIGILSVSQTGDPRLRAIALRGARAGRVAQAATSSSVQGQARRRNAGRG